MLELPLKPLLLLHFVSVSCIFLELFLVFLFPELPPPFLFCSITISRIPFIRILAFFTLPPWLTLPMLLVYTSTHLHIVTLCFWLSPHTPHQSCDYFNVINFSIPNNCSQNCWWTNSCQPHWFVCIICKSLSYCHCMGFAFLSQNYFIFGARLKCNVALPFWRFTFYFKLIAIGAHL